MGDLRGRDQCTRSLHPCAAWRQASMLGCLVLGSNPRLSGLRFGVFLEGPNARKGIVMSLGREPKRDDLMNGSVGRDGVLG